MAGCTHCPTDRAPTVDRAFRGVLWTALAVNATMFAVEIAAGLVASSLSLQADSLDFFGDAANYGITLFALGLAPWVRSGAALFKGASMGAFGLWVIGSALYRAISGGVPEPFIMGPVAILALAANLAVAIMLYRHRNGDSNRQSAWLCTRNDAIANVTVLAAAGGVLASGRGWPDYLVAAAIAGLNLSAAWRVVGMARSELAAGRAAYAEVGR